MTKFEEAQQRRHRPAHARRTAQSHAAFFLPHLRPGMAVLDLGCGPGTITEGLAEAVLPGATVGVDIASDLPESRPGLTYVTADVRDLPFDDASFDAIFACCLLQHLPDPLAVVREAHRVARPGAVIGLVDADWGGQLMYPNDPRLDRALQVAAALRPNTSPYVGRQLRALLAEAGFVRCEGYARVGVDATAEAAALVAEFSAAGYANDATIERAVGLGVATADEMAGFAEAWREWGQHPGAYLARLWCEGVGWARAV
jgi:SAM-dependent methyltransferase